MHYFEVYVRSARYHGSEPLTYEYDQPLPPGSIVMVGLQRQSVMGIVAAEVSKPDFATKPIERSLDLPALPPQSIEMIRWLQSYYPAPLGQIVSIFLPQNLNQTARTNDKVTTTSAKVELPPLSKEQSAGLETIAKAWPKSVLLHGDTGTGKTRVYIELIREQITAGKSAIVLTPEIGLTSQLEQTIAGNFPGQTIILHSTLTPAKRRSAWLRALSGEPVIVVGARSALFSPLPKLGLIVVDEAHDTVYKQEQAPHYHASHVAGKLAHIYKCQLILGTATPLVTDYYTFQSKGLPIVTMRDLASGKERSATVSVIDLRDRSHFTRSPWFSMEMIEAIEYALRNNEQSLLFLNRRGTARSVICQNCGWQALCPRCDLPLTYHGDSHHLQCHTCGHKESAPSSCPQCKSSEIVYRSIGTKSLLAEVERLFPEARVQRFDSDTLKADRLESQYEKIRDGEIDILVGTQMLGKGLDLPKLGLVGVVMADTSLSFPDYSAEERTFQLITQVIGRVSRGHRPGTVVIQSYHPDSAIIQSAVSRDYKSFYDVQIAERQSFGFPPFYFFLKLLCERATNAGAQKAAQSLATTLRKKGWPIEIVGPSPAFIEKINNRYRWQIIVKTKQRNLLTHCINDLPSGWTYDIDPTNLL